MLKNYCTIIFRNLWKNKLYTVVNIVSLAVGIFLLYGVFRLTATALVIIISTKIRRVFFACSPKCRVLIISKDIVLNTWLLWQKMISLL